MSQIYDFVLLGATGYTGQLCVQYMVDNMPSNVRWAIAGRNKAKVEEVATEMKVTEAGGKWMAVMIMKSRISNDSVF